VKEKDVSHHTCLFRLVRLKSSCGADFDPTPSHNASINTTVYHLQPRTYHPVPLYPHNRLQPPGIMRTSTESLHIQTTCESQKPAPHEKSSSPLLNLPRELRDLVYQYALRTDNGLAYIRRLHFLFWNSAYNEQEEQMSIIAHGEPGKFTESHKWSKIEPTQCFNQLKNTCRQLRNETLGLEVKYNYVSFLGLEPEYPTLEFEKFFATCSPRKVEYFTEIHIQVNTIENDKDAMVEPIESLLPIAEFCRNHPSINVRYIPDRWYQRYFKWYGFFSMAVHLHVIYRGKDIHPAVCELVWWQAADQRILSSTERLHIAALNVPNFRFWLKWYGDFDEAELRKEFDNHKFLTYDHQIYVDLAKEWLDNGI
jgi:hypothetical protein